MVTQRIFESDFDWLTDRMVKTVSSLDEYNANIAKDILVCVDFFATWCPPCRMIAPILEEMAKEFEGKVLFLKVDVDESEEIAGKEGIQAMPTFIFYKNGTRIEDFAGADQDRIQIPLQSIHKHLKYLFMKKYF